MTKETDDIQNRIVEYAGALTYDDLSSEAIHSAKMRTIDTLGVLVGGFFGAPARSARNVVVKMLNPDGATILGTRMKATPDWAAFANATTARAAEFNDLYHWPGSRHGHPSDVLMPVLAVAEYAGRSGRDYILAALLAYEIYLRFCDAVTNPGIDNCNFATLGVAMASGRLLDLTPEQLSNCLSMAAVPNVILNQVRGDHKTHYKVASAGHAGRAGVSAALLAQAGMEGPHLPFVGKAGFRDQVAQGKLTLGAMARRGERFKMLDARTRHRPAMGETHAAIIAAEKLAGQCTDIVQIGRIEVEVHKRAHELVGNRELTWCWAPQTLECANQSIPYLVAVALLEGTVTVRSFDEAHLRNKNIRALIDKIEVIENQAFTKAFKKDVLEDIPSLRGYDRLPSEHRARITVRMKHGGRCTAESGGDLDDLSVQKSDAQIEAKFRELTEDVLGAKRATAILDRLWHLEDLQQIAEIPRAFIFA